MRKELLTTLLLLTVQLTFCQVEVKDLTFDEHYKFERVYSYESINKNKLYTMVKSWMAGYFTDSKSVIRVDDKENGQIKGRYSFTTKNDVYQVKQDLVFLVKDNKVKMIIKDPIERVYRVPGKGYVEREFTAIKYKKKTSKIIAKYWSEIESDYIKFMNNYDENDDW